MLANVRGTLSPAKVVVPANGEIINSSAKIPTEFYICVPRRSAPFSVFYTNAWCNLIRKDTGEGIGPKQVVEVLDGTEKLNYCGVDGYIGPLDMNPKGEGLHIFYVEFHGDAEFEPCKSEEIILKCDQNLADTEIKMEITPIFSDAPLIIRVTGTIRAIGPMPVRERRLPEYSLPLDLMVFDYDPTCTKRLQPVKTVMNNPDGTFVFEYTFTKAGIYRLFVNFLGDDKYASDWSNNGQTTEIKVTEGGEPMSYLQVPIKIVTDATMEYRIVGPNDEKPTPADGYIIDPEPIEIAGVPSKFWIEYKIIKN